MNIVRGIGILAIIAAIGITTQAGPAAKATAEANPAAQKKTVPKAEAPKSGDEKDEAVTMAQVPQVVKQTLSQYAKEVRGERRRKGRR